MNTHQSKNLPIAKCEIVHQTHGRVRIRLDRWRLDRRQQKQVKQALESWEAIAEVRLNPFARSIVINYDAERLSADLVREQLMETIERSEEKGSFVLSHRDRLSPEISSNPSQSMTRQISQCDRSNELTVPTQVLPKISVSAMDEERNSAAIESRTADIPSSSYQQTEVEIMRDSERLERSFLIVFSPGTTTGKRMRLGRQERKVNYGQLSRQIQEIHRTGGKIITVRATA